MVKKQAPIPVTANIFVGFEADPSFNLIGRIRGPNVSVGLCLNLGILGQDHHVDWEAQILYFKLSIQIANNKNAV